MAYAYMLAPTGPSEQTKITAPHLKHKVYVYETLKSEIEKLRQGSLGKFMRTTGATPSITKRVRAYKVLGVTSRAIF